MTNTTVADRAKKKMFEPAQPTLDAVLCYVPGMHEDFLPSITSNLKKRAPFASVVFAPDRHGDVNKNYQREFRRSKAEYCLTVDAHMRFNHNFKKAWDALWRDKLPYMVLSMTNIPVSKGPNRRFINKVITIPPLNLGIIAKTSILKKWEPRYKYHPIRQLISFLKEATGMFYQFPKVCGTHDRCTDLWGLLREAYFTGLRDREVPATLIGVDKIRAIARAEGAEPERMIKDLMNLAYHLGYKIGEEAW